eukprot:Gregarina_sp_Poly_1__3681@NODE_2086_length_2704_cov_116_727721_g1346_i0_p2_GENE_NODE_2086_length_2704_cov_116_727721_g1346_i0NODE_2086_length_2704_cov_116_727721_g1346_i0_p2_ORF_typecomplete_len212_score34_11_NODE_2086_length_2704_cov_116_727721_g1346_i0121756
MRIRQLPYKCDQVCDFRVVGTNYVQSQLLILTICFRWDRVVCARWLFLSGTCHGPTNSERKLVEKLKKKLTPAHMAQIEEVLTSSDEKHEQTIEPPVQERPAEKLPIIEKASSKLDEQDTRFFANELRDSGGMDADVESGGTEETGPQLIPSEAVNDEADLPQYNLRQNDDQKDSKDQRDSFDEKSANNVTPKNDENDDADIPPKTVKLCC